MTALILLLIFIVSASESSPLMQVVLLLYREKVLVKNCVDRLLMGAICQSNGPLPVRDDGFLESEASLECLTLSVLNLLDDRLRG